MERPGRDLGLGHPVAALAGAPQRPVHLEQREARVAKGPVTYGELVEHCIALNSVERFERIPYVCYVNFLADYLASEDDASRKDAIAAWKELKMMDVPKTYQSWRAAARKHASRE